MSVTINGTNGIVFNDASSQNTAATGFGFKNRIINGAMVISQRNGTSSVTPTDGQYTLDRWISYQSVASKYSVQQNAGSVALPAGFNNYLGCTSLSAYSVGSSDYFAIAQSIEGFNTADLGWGTANAKTITLSFQVYSSLTGTFGGVLKNSAANRGYPFTYSIPVANTWTTISLTIAGDTTGTWVGATNGTGIQVVFGLGVGSTLSGTAGAWAAGNFVSATGATSVVGTNGATFYITGVQLEKGSTATSFDYRPYGTELQLCQRYAYPIRGGFSGFGNGTTVVDAAVNFPVEMRSVPAVTQGTLVYAAYGTGGSFAQSSNLNSLPTFYTQNGCTLRFSNFTGLTNNAVFILVPNSTTSAVTTYGCLLTAEL